MRQDVQRVIEERYDSSRRNHTRNGVQFELTLTEFTAMWSRYRIQKIECFLDDNRHAAMRKWFRHPDHGPVCTWVSKEARTTNSINVQTAKVTTRKESKWIFYLRTGEKHNAKAIAKMCKPKSDKQKLNMSKPKSTNHRSAMSAAAKARWARVRMEKEKAK